MKTIGMIILGILVYLILLVPMLIAVAGISAFIIICTPFALAVGIYNGAVESNTNEVEDDNNK